MNNHQGESNKHLKYTIDFSDLKDVVEEMTEKYKKPQNKESKLPCEIPCPKCGSSDVLRNFYREGDAYRLFDKGRKTVSSKNVLYDAFGATVLKDCIIHHCRCCQFEWDTGVLS